MITLISGNSWISERRQNAHLPVGEALVAVSRLLGVGTSQVLSMPNEKKIAQSKELTSVMLKKLFCFVIGTLIHSTKRSLFFFNSKNWPSTTYALNIKHYHIRKVHSSTSCNENKYCFDFIRPCQSPSHSASFPAHHQFPQGRSPKSMFGRCFPI